MASLFEQLEKKILIIDGAMGTMIQAANLTADDLAVKHMKDATNI